MSATHTPPVPVAPTTPVPRRTVPGAVRRKKLLIAIAEHSLLIAAAIAFVFPFVFMVLTLSLIHI